MAMVEELLFESYLHAKGVPYEVVLHADVDDALEKAELLEVPLDAILKAILLETSAGEAIAVLPGSRRIDKKAIADITGDPHVRLADEDELVTHFKNFELGALPPSGGLLGVPMYVDATAFQHERVIVSSGRRGESLMVDLLDLMKPEVVTAGLFSEPLEAEHDFYAEMT